MNLGSISRMLKNLLFFVLIDVSSHGAFALDDAVHSSHVFTNKNEKQPPIEAPDKIRLRELASLLRQSGNVNGTNTGSAQVTAEREGQCKCALGVCGCCSRFLLDTFRQKACVNVTYDPDEFSFTAKILMNDRVLYTRSVSGKNPRPVCVPVPRFPVVRACVRFYNIYFQGRNVHACVNMEGKFQDTILFKVGFDCIRLGANGVALVKPEDGGGVGQVEFLPDDPSEDSDDDYDEEEEDDDDDDYF
ncbi:uncharacterized protein [Venturia canescens]|uniref:uncharacterized protein n=1 Tax=Venturia canescens TaxID=32260 RepID=UPI001C9BF734|nr:uncharacterized protein LOC122413621 [Venturia canescens]